MKLYLVRHGETVDNVAGVYAGSRDSALTNHGVEQAKRLGQYFANNNVQLSHIFASPLSRAFRTAEAIRDAQPKTSTDESAEAVEIVTVKDLTERDYGAYEGRPYASRREWQKTGKDGHEESHGNVESTQSLAKRGDAFLDQHLLPLFPQEANDGEYTVAVVAHGMLLSHLWRRLVLLLPRKNLTVAPEIIAARKEFALEHLGGWQNTGYLELSIRKDDEPLPHESISVGTADESSQTEEAVTLSTPVPPPLQSEGAGLSIAPPRPAEIEMANRKNSRELTGYSTTLLSFNSKKHLEGLKRQPGGIGSLANGQGQQKLDAFFKRQKLT